MACFSIRRMREAVGKHTSEDTSGLCKQDKRTQRYTYRDNVLFTNIKELTWATQYLQVLQIPKKKPKFMHISLRQLLQTLSGGNALSPFSMWASAGLIVKRLLCCVKIPFGKRFFFWFHLKFGSQHVASAFWYQTSRSYCGNMYVVVLCVCVSVHAFMQAATDAAVGSLNQHEMGVLDQAHATEVKRASSSSIYSYRAVVCIHGACTCERLVAGQWSVTSVCEPLTCQRARFGQFSSTRYVSDQL